MIFTQHVSVIWSYYAMKNVVNCLSILALSGLLCMPSAAQGIKANPQAPSAQEPKLRAVPVASGLEHPWGLAFLPQGVPTALRWHAPGSAAMP